MSPAPAAPVTACMLLRLEEGKRNVIMLLVLQSQKDMNVKLCADKGVLIIDHISHSRFWELFFYNFLK